MGIGSARGCKCLSLAASLGAACTGPDVFACRDDDACGTQGRCETTGYCSFPADDCASGRRYGQHTPAPLSEACVEPDLDDGSTSATTSTSTASSSSASTSPSSESSSDTTSSSETTGAGPSTDPITISDSSSISGDPLESSTGSRRIVLGPLAIATDLDDGAMWPALDMTQAGWFPSGETAGRGFLGEFPVGRAYYGYFRFQIPEALPPGTVVLSAVFELDGFGTYMWTPRTDALRIWTQLASDAPQVTGIADYPENQNMQGPSLSDESVRWPGMGGLAWDPDGVNPSPELAAPFQELIDSVGGLGPDTHIQLWIGADALGTGNREVGWVDASAGNGAGARLTLDVLLP